MKSITFFGILIVFVFVLGIISTVDAHPHITIDLMESHYHDKEFQENFLVHTFTDVIFSIFDFFNSSFKN